MKTRNLTNKQCLHAWAQNCHEYGSTSRGSLHFEKGTLYSYSTPIANFVEHKGRTACLITTQRYSATTSIKHTPRTYDIPDRFKVFYVKYIGANGGRAPYSDDIHRDNLKELAATYQQNLTNLARAKNHADRYVDSLHTQRQNAVDYSAFFGVRFNIDKNFPLPSPNVIEDALKQARKRKVALHANCERELEGYLRGDALLSYTFRNNASLQQKEKATAHAIHDWRKGVDWPHGLEYPKNVLLRVKGENIETSRGAKFPAKHGLKAWPLIKRCKDQGKVWEKNGHKIPLGLFEIDRIEADGTVKAGCHVVPFSEIERIASQLNDKESVS